MSKSDERWLKAARKLDETALGEVYDALSPELYRYAYRLVGDADRAEDLLSETFLRFLRAIQAGGGPTSHLRAYLYRTLHNLVMDQHRRKDLAITGLVTDHIPAGEDANPAATVQAQLEQHEARGLLWKLTAEQRQVIVLKFFQDCTNGEVAEIIEKSEGAVKALQHRGLAALRRLMEKRAADRERI